MLPFVHAPSIVELPDGELFAVWFADFLPKSVILGSRRPVGAKGWTRPFVVHRTEGASSKNPVLYMGQGNDLILFWADEKRFFKLVRDVVYMKVSTDKGRTWGQPRRIEGLAWFLTKNHPVRLADGSIVLPVYTDLSTSSAVAISRDGGMTWDGPKYMLFFFGIQPTIIQRSDSSLFALMRYGMPPRLAWQATSSNGGSGWTEMKYSNVDNPGTALEMIKLKNGHVAMAFNNSKKDLSELSLAISHDEGRTWPYIKKIDSASGDKITYPSIIQDAKGLIHVLYSCNKRQGISHFVTDEDWVRGR
jgi:predicted neuraminidase